MKKYVLFDLDGTLTDPSEGITNSIAYGLEKFGIAIENKSDLNKYIGPPLIESFINDFHMTEAQAQRCLMCFREYFESKGIYENKIYPGISDMLEKLKNAGFEIVLATSKPELYAVLIIEYFKLDSFFSKICGNDMKETRSSKSEIISYIKTFFTDICGDNTIMVGDRKYDINGASAHGIDTIAVLYGYGTNDELVQAKYIVSNVDELYEAIVNA